jgi:hypothetical protein
MLEAIADGNAPGKIHIRAGVKSKLKIASKILKRIGHIGMSERALHRSGVFVFSIMCRPMACRAE